MEQQIEDERVRFKVESLEITRKIEVDQREVSTGTEDLNIDGKQNDFFFFL